MTSHATSAPARLSMTQVLLCGAAFLPPAAAAWLSLLLALLLAGRFFFWKPLLALRRLDLGIGYGVDGGELQRTEEPADHEDDHDQEQRRRQQRRGYTAEQLAEGEVAEADEEVLEQLPRQGLWVDVEV